VDWEREGEERGDDIVARVPLGCVNGSTWVVARQGQERKKETWNGVVMSAKAQVPVGPGSAPNAPRRPVVEREDALFKQGVSERGGWVGGGGCGGSGGGLALNRVRWMGNRGVAWLDVVLTQAWIKVARSQGTDEVP